MQDFRSAEALCFAHKVAEEGEHAGIVVENKALGVPLYAHNALEIRTFYGFNDPVGSSCRNAEQGTGGSYRLVVERIYGKGRAERFAYDAVGECLHRVRRHVARHLLRVFEQLSIGHTCFHILMKRTAKGCYQHLNASTNA